MYKQVGFILSGALILISALFFQMRANEATRLQARLKAEDAVVAQLKLQVKMLDQKLSMTTATPAPTVQQDTSLKPQLQADLAVAQKDLAAAQAQMQSLHDQIEQLTAGKKSAVDPSLAGAMQNAQTRLQEIDRQLKAIDQESKNRGEANKNDAQSYHAQMRAEETQAKAQVSEQKTRVKAIETQISTTQKQRTNALRNVQIAELQTQLQLERSKLAGLDQTLQLLNQKEQRDSASNSYEQEQSSNADRDSKSVLMDEQSGLKNDLTNLKSRNDLAKRDVGDIATQINQLHGLEHDANLKIQATQKTILRLKTEIPSSDSTPLK